MTMRHYLLLFIVLFLTLPACAQALQHARMEVVTASGTSVLRVEIAVTPQEQEKGLMNRKRMAPDQGMYFPFSPPVPRIAMWMKDTLLPLDMAFVDPQGRIIKIHTDALPGSLEKIYADGEIAGVLEVPAGTLKRIGAATGDKVTLVKKVAVP